MSIALDHQYAGMLGAYLRNFRRKGKSYNFSCPICGDSQKVRTRARGYLYPSGDRLNYSCFNCNTPIYKMEDLLAQIDTNLRDQYKTDAFLEQDRGPVTVSSSVGLSLVEIDPTLQKISSLAPTHQAKRYVMERWIPSNKHYLLYYTDRFKEFCQRVDPNSYSEIVEEEPRLVIPLIAANGNVNGYQGRSLVEDAFIKYQTVLTHPSNPKLFGLDRLNPNDSCIAFEGPIDSLFIENSFATTGGRIDSGLEQYGISRDRTCVVYDNEPRNPHTVLKMEKAIASGWMVMIWPESFDGLNDINQMVKAGHNPHKLREIIFENSFKGMRATLELSKWKRV